MLKCHACDSALIALDLFRCTTVYKRGLSLFLAQCSYCGAQIAYRLGKVSIEIGYLTGTTEMEYHPARIAAASGYYLKDEGERVTLFYQDEKWEIRVD